MGVPTLVVPSTRRTDGQIDVHCGINECEREYKDFSEWLAVSKLIHRDWFKDLILTTFLRALAGNENLDVPYIPRVLSTL